MTMVDHDPAKGESHDPTSSRPGRVRKGRVLLVEELTGSRNITDIWTWSFRKREDVLS